MRVDHGEIGGDRWLDDHCLHSMLWNQAKEIKYSKHEENEVMNCTVVFTALIFVNEWNARRNQMETEQAITWWEYSLANWINIFIALIDEWHLSISKGAKTVNVTITVIVWIWIVDKVMKNSQIYTNINLIWEYGRIQKEMDTPSRVIFLGPWNS